MPTAVEYAVVHSWHVQNGAGGGPPAQNEASVVQLDLPPSGDWGLAGPLATLLLVVAVLAVVRRRSGTGGGGPVPGGSGHHRWPPAE